MADFLYEFARVLKEIHDFIARHSNHMDDKMLHFLVLGFTGIIIFALTYPMFKRLDKANNSIAMAVLYTLATTVILSISTAFVLDVTPTMIFLPLVFGFVIFPISYLVFKYLDHYEQAFKMTNLFTATMIVLFAFAIEVCQGRTDTGSFEVADALFGIIGYFVMYIIMCIIIAIVQFIFRKKKTK